MMLLVVVVFICFLLIKYSFIIFRLIIYYNIEKTFNLS